MAPYKQEIDYGMIVFLAALLVVCIGGTAAVLPKMLQDNLFSLEQLRNPKPFASIAYVALAFFLSMGALFIYQIADIWRTSKG